MVRCIVHPCQVALHQNERNLEELCHLFWLAFCPSGSSHSQLFGYCRYNNIRVKINIQVESKSDVLDNITTCCIKTRRISRSSSKNKSIFTFFIESDAQRKQKRKLRFIPKMRVARFQTGIYSTKQYNNITRSILCLYLAELHQNNKLFQEILACAHVQNSFANLCSARLSASATCDGRIHSLY